MNDQDLKSGVTDQIKSRKFDEAVHRAVQASYRRNGGNLAQAARAHGVSIGAAYRWKKKDQAIHRDWNQESPSVLEGGAVLGQTANCLAGSSRETLVGALLEEYLVMHKDAVEAIKKQVDTPLQRVDALSRLSQALDRTLRALGKASPEMSRLAMASWVLERQAEFVKNRFEHYLPVFVEVLEPFGAELVREVEKS